MEKTKQKPNKLVILDYTTNIMHLYNVDADIYVNAQYIRSIGYDPDKVVFMWGDVETRDHTGVLTKM